MGYEEGLSRVPFLIAREVWETGSDPPQILKFFGVSKIQKSYLVSRVIDENF